MPIWDPAEARHLACPPFDLTALLVATCRFNAAALRHVQAIGLRQSGWHALRRYYRVSLLEFQQLAIK